VFEWLNEVKRTVAKNTAQITSHHIHKQMEPTLQLTEAEAAITAETLLKHTQVLASDEFEGKLAEFVKR
jgi:hypothetical protein